MSVFNKDPNKDPNISKKERRTKGKLISLRTVDKRNRNLRNFSVVSTILFVVLVLVVNGVFDALLGDKLKWDWSSGQIYSLGEVSKEIVGDMSAPVEIVGLFGEETATYSDVRPLVEEYAQLSKGMITVRYVDPDVVPTIVSEVDPEGYLNPEAGTFVVICKETGKGKVLADADLYQSEVDYTTYTQTVTGLTAEESFTGAIKFVQSTDTPVIYFTSGHDEDDYATEYATLSTVLTNNNFEVRALDLLGATEIPTDCTVLIMANPQNDITTGERKLVSDWLQAGHSLMVLSEFNTTSFPELNTLLADYNIELSNNKIREGDLDHQLGDAYTIRAVAPVNSITTEAIDAYTFLYNARGINQLTNTKEWITVEPLLTTTAEGVAEAGGDVNASSEAGTQNLGLICENTGWVDGSKVTEPARVMVVGDTRAFSETVVQQYGSSIYNVGLFYYSVSWLSGSANADNLYIEAKAPVSYSLTSGNTTTYVVSAAVVMLLIPAALLFMALFVYRKRKHL